jgi:mono/diheme cytochrome c family protein
VGKNRTEREGRLGAQRWPRTCYNAHNTCGGYDGFKAQLRDPANDMPAYSTAVLSDQEIADMYAYVQSLPGARSAKDISILNN